MTLSTRIRKGMLWLFIERPSQWRSFEDFSYLFKTSQEAIGRKLASLPESEANRKQLRHIVGLERWGQERLKVFLGKPFIQDEHHPYKPAEDSSWDDLKSAFMTTRQQSLDLIPQLSQLPIDLKVAHNQLGPLTTKAWLQYLNLHARLESIRLK